MPFNVSLQGRTLSFSAPGGDLLCGSASQYQVVTSTQPITAQNFAAAKPLSGAPAPATAGSSQSMQLPPGAQAYVAIRAVDAAGNVGLPAVVKVG
jgi:hypothetical protein